MYSFVAMLQDGLASLEILAVRNAIAESIVVQNATAVRDAIAESTVVHDATAVRDAIAESIVAHDATAARDSIVVDFHTYFSLQR
ncbi:hypothetical protein P4S91_09595 [Aneurinibacillus aneurinilyticus]|uniref:hypothetical protein n=1 Tax=Aneurinibacillus aneurinilyticus TaxID=1391 RepID=UPI002E1FBD59|nr:hypothetical protein [Aneurinibacillus aneurinilyticus]